MNSSASGSKTNTNMVPAKGSKNVKVQAQAMTSDMLSTFYVMVLLQPLHLT